MQALLALAATLSARGGFLLGRACRRYALAAMFAWFAAVMIVGTVVTTAAALWMHLAQTYSPIDATMLLAGGFAILAIVFAAVAAGIVGVKRTPPATATASLLPVAAMAGSMFAQNKMPLLLGAAVLGVVLANSRRRS
jgi:hypothetical protein